jgi:copper chaperone CopZ
MSSITLDPAATPRARLTLAIYDLGCGGGGVLPIARALMHVPGVIHVHVNPATEMAYIEYHPSVTHPDQLLAAITAAGFHAGELGQHNSVPAGPGSPPAAGLLPGKDWPPGPAFAGPAAGADGPPEAPATGPDRRRLVRFWRAVLAGLLVLGLVVALALAWFPGPSHTAHYTIDLGPAGFQPTTLVVPAGEVVLIQLNNTDAALSARTVGSRHPLADAASSSRHQFAIRELGIDVLLDTGQSTTLTLPPQRPGAYHFVCTLRDHPQTTQELRGTLLVHDPGSSMRP